MLIRRVLFWRGSSASQLLRLWHSACRQLISLLSSGKYFGCPYFSISASLSLSYSFSILLSLFVLHQLKLSYIDFYIKFEASLQALSAVSTSQNQSWWMWWTVNVFRQFSLLICFPELFLVKKKNWVTVLLLLIFVWSLLYAYPHRFLYLYIFYNCLIILSFHGVIVTNKSL